MTTTEHMAAVILRLARRLTEVRKAADGYHCDAIRLGERTHAAEAKLRDCEGRLASECGLTGKLSVALDAAAIARDAEKARADKAEADVAVQMASANRSEARAAELQREVERLTAERNDWAEREGGKAFDAAKAKGECERLTAHMEADRQLALSYLPEKQDRSMHDIINIIGIRWNADRAECERLRGIIGRARLIVDERQIGQMHRILEEADAPTVPRRMKANPDGGKPHDTEHDWIGTCGGYPECEPADAAPAAPFPGPVMGGRGKCPHCGEMVNNVAYHASNACERRPHAMLQPDVASRLNSEISAPKPRRMRANPVRNDLHRAAHNEDSTCPLGRVPCEPVDAEARP